MKPLISLIIPCYNVQNYVQAALQSVADSLSPEHRGQVEWLIVDDGATDQTPDIIARFAAQVLQPQQIPHRIIRQSNAGLSAARNTGLAHAQGEYVLFLDSDDIFVQAALDKILAVLAQQQPDIIEFDAQMFVQPSDLSPQNPTLYGQYFRDTAGKDHQSSLQRAFEENRWYVWSRCYRRSLLERHPFIVGKLFEDMMFTPYVYLDAHTVYRLPEVLLGYRQNAGSITANYDGARKHRTTIGADVHVGSNCVLVAPVTLGAGGTVAAGSVITQDTAPGALAIARGRQSSLPGWQRPAKPSKG